MSDRVFLSILFSSFLNFFFTSLEFVSCKFQFSISHIPLQI